MVKDTTFNFVIDCTDAELAAYKKADAADALMFDRGDLCWCLLTYLILAKRAMVSVSCSNHLVDDAINLVHSDALLHLKGTASQFIVCLQADFPRRHWAHYRILQNKNQLTSNASYIPHWLQPGLLKRDAARRGISRVGYVGQVWNGNLAGSGTDWKRLFEPHGIEFVTQSSAAWHDLRALDVLIAIRSFDTKPHNTKPPSKLLNAWAAGIPFVGGYDSAYRQVGTPGHDYLLAKTPQQAVKAVMRLQADETLYARLVQNGQQKVAQYSNERTAEMWERHLTGPITARYRQWQRRPQYEKWRFATWLRLALLAQQPKEFVKKWLVKAGKLKSFKIAAAFK